jgi:hypothetical protein
LGVCEVVRQLDVQVGQAVRVGLVVAEELLELLPFVGVLL